MAATWPLFIDNPVSIYLLAVIVAAWFGGLYPGLLSLAVSLVISNFLFIEPYFAFGMPGRANVMRMIVVALVGIFIIFVCERLRRQRTAAEADVEALKLADVAVLTSESRLSAIIESAMDAFIGKDLNGVVTSWNPAAESMFGYTSGEMIGETLLRIIPPERRGEEAEILASIARGDAVEHLETIRLKKDGTAINVSITSSPIRNVHGEVIGASKIARDITERTRAEARFRLAVESAPNAMVMADNDGKIILVNAQTEKLFGYHRDELIGLPVETLVPERLRRTHPAHRKAYAADPQVRAMGAGRDLFGLRKDGTEVPVEIGLNPIEMEGHTYVLSSIVDISERKVAEELLRSARERLSSALLAGSIGTWTWDIRNDILIADEFVATTFSLDPSAAAFGLPVAEYMKAVREEDKQPLSDQLSAAIESCGTYDIEYRVRKNDGELQWIQAKGRVEGDADGIAVNFHGAVIDINDRKRIDARFRRLVESNAQGVIFWNTKGEITEANDAFLDIVGYAREDLEAGLLDWAAMTPAEYAHLDVSSLEELAETGISSPIEKEYFRKDGSRVPIMAGAALFEDNPDEGVCFVLDITDRYQIQRALRKSEEQLRAVIENLTEGLIIAGADGKLLHWNRVGVEMFGLKPNEFSVDLAEFGSIFQTTDLKGIPLDANEWPLSRVLAGERLRECEVIVKRLDIPWQRTVSCSGSLVKDADGDSLAFLSITDVTERNQTQQALRESEEHFRFLNDLVESTRRLADAGQIMAVMALMLGEYLGASRCAYADVEEGSERFTILYDYTDGCRSTVGVYDLSLFGTKAMAELHSGQTLIVRNVDEELLPEDGADMFNAIGIKAIITCPLVKDGVLRAMMAVHQTTPRDWKPAEISIVEDVVERCWATIERRAAEEKIYHLNAELEQRVSERTAELAAVNQELESFSYSVSHDLRAPLRHINGFSLALLEDYSDKLDDTGKVYLTQVREASQEMAVLIDDVLKLARVTRAGMNREDVNLSELADEIVAELRKSEPDRTVTVKIEQGLVAIGDKRLLEIALTNLLGNAWKFTSKQAEPEIEFGREQTEKGSAYFVRDNGAGFDMAYVDKLFGAFQRLHSSNDFEGTGIGLATVQRVINRHGGRVWADAQVGKGATFYFTLSGSKESVNG